MNRNSDEDREDLEVLAERRDEPSLAFAQELNAKETFNPQADPQEPSNPSE